MLEPEAESMVDLFSAVTAHLRHDEAALEVLLGDLVDGARTAGFACGAVMTCAEYLRDAAAERQFPPTRMVDLLLAAHRAMTPGTDTTEALLLTAVRSYLDGSVSWWSDAEAAQLMATPYATALGAVRLTSGALSWHAADLGVAAVDLSAQACLALAERSCAAAS